MRRRFRFLLTAILVLAVPLQGISATAACFCPAVEHHDHDADTGGTAFEPCVACCAGAVAGNPPFSVPSGPASAPHATELPAPASVRLDVPDPPPLAG
jgi:hypothetical protein